MKKTFPLILFFSLLMSACFTEEKDYTPDQLYGKWVSGTEYYRFDEDMMGATWDTGDDVYESEAQPFEWQVAGDQLTMVHMMEMGGRIPKAYTITSLTYNTLQFRDDYNQSFTYTRVSK